MYLVMLKDLVGKNGRAGGQENGGRQVAETAWDERTPLRQIPALFEAEADVLEDGEVRKQGVVLKDSADVAPIRRKMRNRLTIEQNRAGSGSIEASDEAECGGFAAARWPNQREKLARADAEGDVVYAAVTREVFRESLKLNHCVHFTNHHCSANCGTAL